jgi:hypothetical protein
MGRENKGPAEARLEKRPVSRRAGARRGGGEMYERSDRDPDRGGFFERRGRFGGLAGVDGQSRWEFLFISLFFPSFRVERGMMCVRERERERMGPRVGRDRIGERGVLYDGPRPRLYHGSLNLRFSTTTTTTAAAAAAASAPTFRKRETGTERE